MDNNNHILSVLVPDASKTVLAAGNPIESLTPNQIGVFDANTHLSLDGTEKVREFFLAVGKDSTGNGTIDKIHKSSGQNIQLNGIDAYTFKPHTAGEPQITNITDLEAMCGKEYAIKLTFENSEILNAQHTIPFTKTYTGVSSCCSDCEPCAVGNSVALVKSFINSFNADSSGFVVATGLVLTAITAVTHGVVADLAIGDIITAADIEAVIVFNQAQEDDPLMPSNKVKIGIQLTTVPSTLQEYCCINLNFMKLQQTSIKVSFVEGFTCGGKVETIQEPSYEQGTGYTLRNREYWTEGHDNAGPYVVSSVTSLPRSGFKYYIDEDKNYDQIYLMYSFTSTSTTAERQHRNLSTLIATDSSNGTMKNSLLIVLDALVSPKGFDALADEASIASEDPTVIENSGDADDINKNGVG